MIRGTSQLAVRVDVLLWLAEILLTRPRQEEALR